MSKNVIESQVLKTIAPNNAQAQIIQTAAKDFISELKKNIKDAEVILGGSVAKGTFLSYKSDIDVFVRFNYNQYKDQSSKISAILGSALKKSFPKEKIEKVHGSRDYFQIQKDNFDFEVVPILFIEKATDAINITDISPLHSVWINKQKKSIKDQIRLTKQFAKAQGFYGAESFISGFSGYALEILTVNYKSFHQLLEAATKWKKKQVIDIENYHQGKDIFMEIDISKLNSPLIVVDPVDKYRNVTAALQIEKWQKFKKAAKQYIKAPNFSFFENQLISKEFATKFAKEKKRNLIYFEIKAVKGKRDVVGCKILKSIEHLKTKLEGFQIKESDWQWEPGIPARVYITTSKSMLPEETIKKGPPVKMTDAAKNFKLKNKKHQIIEKEGHLHAIVPVVTRGLEANVKQILKNKYITEKIAKIIELEVITK